MDHLEALLVELVAIAARDIALEVAAPSKHTFAIAFAKVLEEDFLSNESVFV